VTWKTRHFTSEHYKVHKIDVFEKVIPAADFGISADDVCQELEKLADVC